MPRDRRMVCTSVIGISSQIQRFKKMIEPITDKSVFIASFRHFSTYFLLICRKKQRTFLFPIHQKLIIEAKKGLYSHSSVVRWCNKQYLQNFYIRHCFYVPKEYLLDFFVSRHFINISVKSELHKERNQQLIQYQTEQSSK